MLIEAFCCIMATFNIDTLKHTEHLNIEKLLFSFSTPGRGPIAV